MALLKAFLQRLRNTSSTKLGFLSPLLSKKSKKSTDKIQGDKVTAQQLAQLFPIRNLSEEIRQTFATENQAEFIQAGTVLCTINKPADCALYLLSGTLKLTDNDGKNFEINAKNPKAKFPICSGEVYSATVIAKTDVRVLRVSLKIMSTINRAQHMAIEIPSQMLGNRLLNLFAEHYQNHELEIPSLPEVASKISQAVEHENNIENVVKIIQFDPAIAAKVIEVANCPLYLAWEPVKNCTEAVNRIGLKATRSLIIAISTKQILQSNATPIRGYLEKYWKQSLYISALSHAIATNSRQQDPDNALLAGLICDIGAIPFLSFVSNLPKDYINEVEIEEAIPVIKGVVGATVLREWGFADEFVSVALTSNNWYQSTDNKLSLSDVVTLSRLHSVIGSSAANNLPAIGSIPAANKLKHFALTPENSMAVLTQAKIRINTAMSILNR